MNIRKVASLALAAALQVLPITRVFVAATPATGSSFAIVSTWIAGALALLGGVDAVSGASTTITSATTARGTNGVPFSYRITTGPEVANTFSATPLPAGLTVSTTSGRITGTPTVSGVFSVALTASDGGRADRTVRATLTLTIVDGGGGGVVAPAITTQPVSQTVTAGANVTFSIVASGTAPLSYQWRRNGANVAGATSATLNLTAVTTNQAGSYTCVVTNSAGSATSTAATLTVNPAITAPTITTQPVSQTVTAGANVTFSIVASGTAPLSYQWRRNGANVAGATSATLNLTAVTTNQAGSYTCVVTNSAGSATSAAATLTVNAAPVAPGITTQPVSQTVTAGANVTFSIVASGTAPLSYQWRRNGANVAGATSATLNLTAVTTNQAGSYTCVVTNSAGSATSAAATLTVNAAPVAPSITTQPVSQTVTAGANVTFSIVASGTAPLSYQWRRNGANVAGATGATLNLTAVTTNQAGSYTCVVTNSAGAATSTAATLTVNPAITAPTITTQPASQSVTAGANVTFVVAAGGTGPLSFQWRRDGANLAGATSASLTLNNVTTNQAGSYTCVVTNAAGSATSAAATLTVNAAPVPPTITTQPLNQTVVAGANVSFTVAATGTGPLAYQWRRNGVSVAGGTAATLSLNNVTTNQAGSYTCVVTNAVGSATSSAATLTVNPAAVAPTITSQPSSQIVTAGANVSFTVTASGTAPLSYQWRRNGANVAGATAATLNLLGVTTNQAGTYSCVVTNAAGNATSSGATLTVQPVVPSASVLTVTIQGQGTVSPNLNGTTLTVGQSYTMTATAASGSTFAGWSGGMSSSSATLTFVMTSNLTLQANFVASPFAAAAGLYNGLFFETDEVRVTSAGAFNLRSDASGNYSGWLQQGFTRHSVSGRLDSSLRATNVISRWNAPALTVEWQLGQDAALGQVAGRVTDGNWVAVLGGGRTAGSAALAGEYTVVIPGRVGDARIPAGDSYGTLHVGADGLATLTSTLADGTQFAQSAYLTEDGAWPVYVSLYAAKGLAVSWLRFADESQSDVRGDWVWIKQAGASTTSYPLGFTNETEAVGARYVAPTPAGKVLNLSLATMGFGSFNNAVSVNAGSQIVNLSPNPLTVNFTTASGKFSGQVLDPNTGAMRAFGGVVLQKQNAAFGSTTAPAPVSRVVLTAPQPPQSNPKMRRPSAVIME